MSRRKATSVARWDTGAPSIAASAQPKQKTTPLASVRSTGLARQLSAHEREARFRAEAQEREADDETRRAEAELAKVLAETQRRRIDDLRQKQVQEQLNAARKRELSERFEVELDRVLGAHSLPAILQHFGVSNMKQLLVRYHPDRTPPNSCFEEAVRREVVFKWVQQKRNQIHASGLHRQSSVESAEVKARTKRRSEQAQARRQADAAAVVAKAKAAGAVLRLLPPSGSLGPDQGDAAYGYYEVVDHGHNGKPMYRKIVTTQGKAFPWATQADHIYWTGTTWHIGGVGSQEGAGYWYLPPKFAAFGQGIQPPMEGWQPPQAAKDPAGGVASPYMWSNPPTLQWL